MLHRPTLAALIGPADSQPARNEAMARADLEYGYTLAEISRRTGLHYVTVSRIIKAIEDKTP